MREKEPDFEKISKGPEEGGAPREGAEGQLPSAETGPKMEMTAEQEEAAGKILAKQLRVKGRYPRRKILAGVAALGGALVVGIKYWKQFSEEELARKVEEAYQSGLEAEREAEDREAGQWEAAEAKARKAALKKPAAERETTYTIKTIEAAMPKVLYALNRLVLAQERDLRRLNKDAAQLIYNEACNQVFGLLHIVHKVASNVNVPQADLKVATQVSQIIGKAKVIVIKDAKEHFYDDGSIRASVAIWREKGDPKVAMNINNINQGIARGDKATFAKGGFVWLPSTETSELSVKLSSVSFKNQ